MYRFLDTAGIRRKGKTKLIAEKLSVIMARQHLERADVAVLVVDASIGVTSHDATIAQLCGAVGTLRHHRDEQVGPGAGGRARKAGAREKARSGERSGATGNVSPAQARWRTTSRWCGKN